MPERVGPFEVQAELGRGSAGIVYKVTKPPEQRPLALKVLFPGTLEAAGGLTRFRREAQALLTLSHPGIVRVYETGSTPKGQPYIALEFEPGGCLQERLRRGPLPVAQAVSIALRLSEAIAHAHDHSILHRDLKPHNVLFDAEGQPLITDFGLARAVGRDERITRTGEMLGTPTYMPPEQVQGDPSLIGPASDIYGLGGVLYAMLCGESPFRGESVVDILKAVLNDPPRPPRQLRPEVDPQLEAIVLRCLAKEPAARYPDARSLAQDLAGWSPSAAAAAPAGAAPEPKGADWGVRFALAGVALMMTAGAVVAGWIMTRPPPAEVATPTVSPDAPLSQPKPPTPTPTPTLTPRDEAYRAVARVKELSKARAWKEAIEAGEMAVRLHRDRKTLTARAEARYKGGRVAAALEDFNALVAMHPDDVGLRVDRGHVRFSLRQWKQARADYEHALKLGPKNARALAALGWALWHIDGDVDGAERLWLASKRIKATPDGVAGLAWVAHKRGLFKVCLDRAAEALALDPLTIRASEARAAALLRLGRVAEACDAFEELAERDPTNPRFQTTSAKLAWKLKDRRKVLARLQSALQKHFPKGHPRRQELVELERAFKAQLAKEE